MEEIKKFKDIKDQQLRNNIENQKEIFENSIEEIKEIINKHQVENNEEFLLESEEVSNKINHELTEEEEKTINQIVDIFDKEYKDKGKSFVEFQNDVLNEGKLGQLLGGLSGLALGKTMGKILGNVLGLEEDGLLYDLFTSRLFGASLGAALGKRI